MKTNKFLLFFSLLFVSLFMVSCGDDDDEPETKDTYKVRYEASCDNPNIVMRVFYSTGNGDLSNIEETTTEVLLKSPFTFELEMNKNEVCYISAQAQAVEEESGIIPDDVTYTTTIYVDNSKVVTKSAKTVAVSYHLLGASN